MCGVIIQETCYIRYGYHFSRKENYIYGSTYVWVTIHDEYRVQ